MAEITRLSGIFKWNYIFWTLFGIWPGKFPKNIYRYYSVVYLVITLLIYNVLLTLNLIYTPRQLEMLIREVIFYFTEIAVAAKVLMIIVMRDKIVAILELIDCKEFRPDEEETKDIVNGNVSKFTTYFNHYTVLSNLAYASQVVLPIFLKLVFGTSVELPICQYYFLTDSDRDNYFSLLFIYQSIGMYGHMMYNVNIDTFIAGLIIIAVTQIKVLNYKFNHLKSPEIENQATDLEYNYMTKLNRYLRNYDIILKYYAMIQDVISVTMFVQFGIASLVICVILCGLIQPSSTETIVFLTLYLFTMTFQLFVPSWLGTQLDFESKELMFAAYNSDWIPRSAAFKRSIWLFIERAKIPIVLTGLKMFPLSLVSFTSIIKSAYSFFTLVRNVQEGQNM